MSAHFNQRSQEFDAELLQRALLLKHEARERRRRFREGCVIVFAVACILGTAYLLAQAINTAI